MIVCALFACVSFASVGFAQDNTSTDQLDSATTLSAPQAGVLPEEVKRPNSVPSVAERDELKEPAEKRIHGAAVLGALPGFGVGHLVAGRRKTGLRLMAIQATGLGAFLLGGLGVVSTGTSRRVIFPSLLLVGFGGASFAFAWISDLLGTATLGRTKGVAMQRSRAELSVGALWVADPLFKYGPFVSVGGRFRHKHFEIGLQTQVALSDNNQRFKLRTTYYVFGEKRRDATLALSVGIAFHRFGSDAFRTLSGDLALQGRLPLSVLGSSLKSFFVEGELGLGLQGFGYDAIPGGGIGDDSNALLLLRMGYGVFLGDRGELLFEYNHRRDTFAGGLSVNGIAAGSFGYVGAIGRGFFSNGPWGIEAYAQIGSAFVGGINLRYRWLPN